ncbi:Permease of the drug/metabolite transporter (DMT) superfamily [Cohaesibacter sp. ES.047]|uniref:DMT family transporter n=1 Tax=Cohaesibacter sp. ES.047 TaxID=1798205 RepID=UPI000BB81E3F|nr:DMT family transporter [Cohaesibacter sp. ES.047]SNY92019.1 Permease of the drug/metabolite transporter (DMT) superfamily [Cohaesibacter sp. ES.047]
MRISGPVFALLAVTIFSIQDAITKHVGQLYSPFLISMIRYWAFALFGVLLVMNTKGSFRQAIHTARPMLQIGRGLLLVVQILLSILSFAYVGLAQSQAIFVAAPLMVALLSIPILGEIIGWKRWMAIAVGMCGVLIIINPFDADFSNYTFLPVFCVFTLSLYNILTRLAGRTDPPQVSFFYTGVIGLVVTSCIGPFFWTDIPLADWVWLIALCLTGVSGHYCLIRALDLSEAVTVQTLSYLQLVYGLAYGYFIFNENLTMVMLLGSMLVVFAGVFTIWRDHRLKRAGKA